MNHAINYSAFTCTKLIFHICVDIAYSGLILSTLNIFSKHLFDIQSANN